MEASPIDFSGGSLEVILKYQNFAFISCLRSNNISRISIGKCLQSFYSVFGLYFLILGFQNPLVKKGFVATTILHRTTEISYHLGLCTRPNSILSVSWMQNSTASRKRIRYRVSPSQRIIHFPINISLFLQTAANASFLESQLHFWVVLPLAIVI